MKKRTKRLLSMLLVAIMTVSMIPMTAFATSTTEAIVADDSVDATDTQADLTISTAEELVAFAKDVNENKNGYSGKLVVLAADIDLAGSETNLWTPIGANGDSEPKFRGTFDGKGYTIKNLYVKQGAAYHSAGLFGATNGTIKNLTIDGAYVESLSSGNITVNGTAVVAGSTAYGATIDGVHVRNATVKGNRYVAGIVGYMDGTVKNCSIENVTLVATPDDLTGSYDNGDKVGGIVGYTNSNAIEISGCELKGTVSITGYRDIGGIVGMVQPNAKVSNNTNSAKLIITVDQMTNSYGEKDANAGEFTGRGTSSEESIDNTTTEGASFTKTEFEGAAKIGDKKYTTLEAAIAAARDGDTIELLADVEIIETLDVSSNSDFDKINVTIDGNSHTIKAVSSDYFTANSNAWMVDIAWNVTINDLTFDANNLGIRGVQFYTSNSTLNNVTIKNVNNNSWGYTDYALHLNASTVDINGNFVLDDCEHGHVILAYGSGIPEAYSSCEVDIFGATIDGVTTIANLVVQPGIEVDIKLDDSEWLSNGSSYVRKDETIHADAKIGNIYYTTLADALAAAKSGDTVTLLDDIAYEVLHDVKVPAGVVIDGNGNTISIGTVGNYSKNAVFYSDGAYTVKNLTLNVGEAGAGASAFNMANGGTLENVTVNGGVENGVYADKIVMVTGCVFKNSSWGVYSEFDTATVIITGSTFNSPRAAVLRGADIFTDNIVYGNKGVSLASTEATITGNTFTGDRAISVSGNIHGSATIKNNKFLDGSYVEVARQNSPVLSENYWSNGYTSQIVPDGDVVIGASVDSYYADEDLTVLVTIYAAEVVNGDKYATLGEALYAAQDGETVTLLKDIADEYDGDRDFIMIPAGVTLNLNGKYLTAVNMIAYGDVIDTADEVGGIIIDDDGTKNIIHLQPTNTYLPIYDSTEGCYRFFEVNFATLKDPIYDSSKNTVQFNFLPSLANDDTEAQKSTFFALLADEGNGLDIHVDITVSGATYKLNFVFSNELVKAYASKKGEAAMTIKLSGLENLTVGTEIAAVGTIKSATGCESGSKTRTYTIA